MSRRSFVRHFKAATGATPHAWLLSQRLSRAEELLETTTLPIEQIADRVGYRSAAVFREQFTARRGVPPRDYRQTFRRMALAVPSTYRRPASARDAPRSGPSRALPGRRLCETTAVSGDDPQTTRVSDLFDPEPRTWGLRGDPHLWRALRARLAGQDAPASAGELASLLHTAFRELTGTDLTNDPASSAYLEQYAHGGMSSGMISLDTWRQQLMPMLLERGRARLPGRPQNANQEHTDS
jgi:hypothetical protein